MRIKSLAQGENILMLGFEPSTFVSKIDILTTTPIVHLFLRIGVTKADLKHCWKIQDARDELNRSVREGRIQSRHSIKSLEGMGSSSHDLGAELRMHSFTVNCDTFSNEEKVAAVVPVTSVEVTCSEAMLAQSFYTLLVKCLMKILGRSALG